MPHVLGWLAEDYGAAGDGATNDSPAFAGLIDGMKTRLAGQHKQHVALRPKVYRVNSPIVLNASGLQIHGHNRVDTVIEAGPSFPAGLPLIEVLASNGNTQLSEIEIGNVMLRRQNANGPLVRFGGVLNCTLSNCILGACNTYVTVHKPGSATNLQLLLTMLDCVGTPSTGISATSIDALRVTHSKIKCSGAGAVGINLSTGESCSAHDVLFENCGSAPLRLKNSVIDFLFIGGGKLGSITRWIDDDDTCSGVVYGRKWSLQPPLGRWNMHGPTHEHNA